MLLCTDLGLRRSPDGPDTVQSITRLHSLFLFHLTGADNPIPSTNFELTVCSRRGEKETKRRKEERVIKKKKEVDKGGSRT